MRNRLSPLYRDSVLHVQFPEIHFTLTSYTQSFAIVFVKIPSNPSYWVTNIRVGKGGWGGMAPLDFHT